MQAIDRVVAIALGRVRRQLADVVTAIGEVEEVDTAQAVGDPGQLVGGVVGEGRDGRVRVVLLEEVGVGVEPEGGGVRQSWTVGCIPRTMRPGQIYLPKLESCVGPKDLYE